MLLRRPFSIVAATCVIALGVTVGATAAPASAPTDTASAFTTGFFAGDATVCDLASADVQALLARLTSAADCASAMALVRQGVAADADAAEKDELRAAHGAALVASVDHYGALGGKAWFSKRFPLAALARAIHAEQPDLRVRLGTGPAAARASAANVVVLDTRRSTPKRLFLYGESGVGAIWQLSAAPTSKPAVTRSTVRGIAATAPAPHVNAFAFAPAAPGDPTLVVTSLVVDDDPTELLLPIGADGLVQSFLVGRAIAPLTAGTGAADATAFAAALTQAYASTEKQALCGLFDPALVQILGGECSLISKATTAVDVTTPAQRVSTVDGTTLVAVKLGDAPNQLTAVNLAVPNGTGYRVTGIFFDIDELIRLIDRPI